MLVGMGMGMGRHAASEPHGRGKKGGRSHSFGFPPLSKVCQLRICMVYVVTVVRYVLLTSAREKSGAVVGKNEGQGAKLEGFS
jgi:hypothetical protein